MGRELDELDIFGLNYLFIDNQISNVLKQKAKQRNWKRFHKTQLYFEDTIMYVSMSCTISYTTLEGRQRQYLEFQVDKKTMWSTILEKDTREMKFEFRGMRQHPITHKPIRVLRLKVCSCGDVVLNDL